MRCEQYGIDLVNGKYADADSVNFYLLGDEDIQSWIRRPISSPEGIKTGLAGVYFQKYELYALLMLGHCIDFKGRDAYWLRAVLMTREQYLAVNANPLPLIPQLERKPLSHQQMTFEELASPNIPDYLLHLQSMINSLSPEERFINFRIGSFINNPPDEKFDFTFISHLTI